MKIIFLDIDGVLNNELWYQTDNYKEKIKNIKEDYESTQFCSRCVGLLNYLVEKTGAKIVVSSSWRSGRTVEELQQLFEKVFIEGEVIDKTPRLSFIGLEDYHYSVPRGCEIKAWLETNKDKLGDKMSNLKYVILDDDSDMLYWQRNNFLQVDSYCGLTYNLIDKAIKILNRK